MGSYLNVEVWRLFRMVNDLEQYVSYLKNNGSFDEINIHNFEDLIVRSLEKGAFIEANSLIHNVIEFYLQSKILNYVLSLFGISESNSQKVNDRIFAEHKDELVEKSKILSNRKNSDYIKYLYDYVEIGYLLGLIDKGLYSKILNFNENRNKYVHQLLKRSGKFKFRDIVANARLGREIQMRLSPVGHSEKDIESVLKKFDEFVKKNAQEYIG